MDAFNFAFTLFGLILGFTLVEILSGVAKVVKARQRVKVGWLTLPLAVFVMLDVLSFWQIAWAARSIVPITYGALLLGLAITATYYMAASWVFPEALDDGTDLDAHYFVHRRFVLSVIWLINTLTFTSIQWRTGYKLSNLEMALIGAYTLCVGVAVVSRSKGLNAVALAGLIAIYVVNALL